MIFGINGPKPGWEGFISTEHLPVNLNLYIELKSATNPHESRHQKKMMFCAQQVR